MHFADVPAVGRITVTNPGILRALEHLNNGKEYADQIKPFNFLLSCHVSPFGHPLGIDVERFHLIAPFETNPNKWTEGKWIDQYSGNEYRVCTNGNYRSRQSARVKTFEEVLEEYEFHPESKCADARGRCSTRQTQGLLYRRHIRLGAQKVLPGEPYARGKIVNYICKIVITLIIGEVNAGLGTLVGERVCADSREDSRNRETDASDLSEQHPLDINAEKFKELSPRSQEKVLDVFRCIRKHGIPIGGRRAGGPSR